MPNLLRNLPSVTQLLESAPLKKWIDTVNRNVVVDGVRTFLDEFRDQVNAATDEIAIPSVQDLAEKISTWLQREEQPYLQPVINGTGIILHTGLGRAPLSASALRAVTRIAAGYASVEVNLKTGERGQRVEAVSRLLRELTGAEAAVVVNNNAAATMLTLSALAAGKEVLVSRGELIEIGGSYRLPQVMECSGAKLREVGTTNKTHLSDFESAINENTGAILKVHPSNYQIVGFTESVTTRQLAGLAASRRIPVIDDIGSGALVDFAQFGLRDEPMAAHSVQAGADVTLFSGDKLLGGPQCGIIVGKKVWTDRILASPLMRAMRVDKMTLAALVETLHSYRNMEHAKQEIPILRMLSMPLENLQLRATKLVQLISHLPGLANCEVVEDQSMLGGGSLPTQTIPTYCLAVSVTSGSLDQLAGRLRSCRPAVLGRVSKDRLLLDLRTILPSQDLDVANAFESIMESSQNAGQDEISDSGEK